MPPKAADKKPAAKAPSTASKAPEKKDAGKKTAASGEKKKRSKTRKETYSSYIYKGLSTLDFFHFSIAFDSNFGIQSSSRSTLTPVFPTAPCPSSTRSSTVSFFLRIHFSFLTHFNHTDLNRYLRARCHRGFQAGCLQQEVHNLFPRDPDICPVDPAR